MNRFRRLLVSHCRGSAIVLILSAALVVGVRPGVSAVEQLQYTALGDSLAFGAFALPGKGYVPVYARHLQTDLQLPVTLVPLGIPGWTSGELLSALRGNFLFRVSVFTSEVVTWNIGGNDLNAARSRYKSKNCGGADNQDCLRAAVLALKANWSDIIAEIQHLRWQRRTLVRTTDIYNPYVNVDRASDTWPGDAGNDLAVLKPYVDDVNAYILNTSTAQNIGCARVYLAFNGPFGTDDPADKGLLAFDRFHPNSAGHARIAQLLRQLGYEQDVP
jgi:lysophospholipase L1-like esterase